MRKYFGCSLIILALITFLIWGINKVVHSLIPPNINDEIVLFFAIFTVLIGTLSGLKDFIELLQSLFEHKDKDSDSPVFSEPSTHYYSPPQYPPPNYAQNEKTNKGSYIRTSPDGSSEVRVSSEDGGMSSATFESIKIGGGSVDGGSLEITWENPNSDGTTDIHRERYIGPKYKGEDYEKHSGKIEHYGPESNFDDYEK
jgi:hypothetical protein